MIKLFAIFRLAVFSGLSRDKSSLTVDVGKKTLGFVLSVPLKKGLCLSVSFFKDFSVNASISNGEKSDFSERFMKSIDLLARANPAL